MILYILLAVFAYLVGSIPSALIVGMNFNNGIDIRERGSGNLGTTNASRHLKKKNTALIALFDVFIKGVLVVVVANYFLKSNGSDVPGLLFGFISIIGHNFPIFAGFRGGKGMATTIGLAFAHGFLIGLGVCGLFILIMGITGYVALTSMLTTAIISALAIIYLDYPVYLEVIIASFAMVMVYQHRANIKRMLNKEEPRVNVMNFFKWMGTMLFTNK